MLSTAWFGVWFGAGSSYGVPSRWPDGREDAVAGHSGAAVVTGGASFHLLTQLSFFAGNTELAKGYMILLLASSFVGRGRPAFCVSQRSQVGQGRKGGNGLGNQEAGNLFQADLPTCRYYPPGSQSLPASPPRERTESAHFRLGVAARGDLGTSELALQ